MDVKFSKLCTMLRHFDGDQCVAIELSLRPQGIESPHVVIKSIIEARLYNEDFIRIPCKHSHEHTASKLQSCTYFCALKECSYFDVGMLYRVAIEIILVVTKILKYILMINTTLVTRILTIND